MTTKYRFSPVTKKIALFFSALSLLSGAGFPSDYYAIKTPAKQKVAFFEHLYPLIEKENIKIIEERNFVKKVFKKNIFNIDVNSRDFLKLLKLKKRYKVKKLFNRDSYLRNICTVPPSLALAQAAIESGWGKSRFVKEANNIFGQWTYSGKGLIPGSREEGATHRIAVFKSLQASIAGYLFNINVGWAYSELRKVREKLKSEGKSPDSMMLAQGLIKYSQLKHKYVQMVKNMIKKNDLEKYDSKFYELSKTVCLD